MAWAGRCVKEKGAVVGTGTFGVVHIATHRQTNTPVAIKTVSKSEVLKARQAEHLLAEHAVLETVCGGGGVVVCGVGGVRRLGMGVRRRVWRRVRGVCVVAWAGMGVGRRVGVGVGMGVYECVHGVLVACAWCARRVCMVCSSRGHGVLVAWAWCGRRGGSGCLAGERRVRGGAGGGCVVGGGWRGVSWVGGGCVLVVSCRGMRVVCTV